MSFGTTMLSILAPVAQSLEVAELEKLEELQFKADPELAVAILKSGHAFYSNLEILSTKSQSAFVKAIVAGGKQAIEEEAALHNVTL